MRVSKSPGGSWRRDEFYGYEILSIHTIYFLVGFRFLFIIFIWSIRADKMRTCIDGVAWAVVEGRARIMRGSEERRNNAQPIEWGRASRERPDHRARCFQTTNKPLLLSMSIEITCLEARPGPARMTHCRHTEWTPHERVGNAKPFNNHEYKNCYERAMVTLAVLSRWVIPWGILAFKLSGHHLS